MLLWFWFYDTQLKTALLLQQIILLLFVLNVHGQSIFLVCRSVSDSVIDALADNCPDIEQVDVLGTSLVHEDAIRR